MFSYRGDKLMAELHQVEHDLLFLDACQRQNTDNMSNVGTTVTELKRNMQKLSKCSSTSDACELVLTKMNDVLSLASSLESQVSDRSLTLRMLRFHFFKARIAFSRWLFPNLPSHCERLLRTPLIDVLLGEKWLHRLCMSAFSMVEAWIQDKAFATHEYDFLLDFGSRVHIARTNRKYIMDEGGKQTATIYIVQDIICSWIDDIQRQDMWRIWTIESIESVFGEAVLTLDATWNTYHTITRAGVLKRLAGRTSTDPKDLESFKTTIVSHPLATKGALCSSIVLQLFSLVARHARGDPIDLREIHQEKPLGSQGDPSVIQVAPGMPRTPRAPRALGLPRLPSDPSDLIQ